MALSNSQIQEKIKTPARKNQLRKAVEHQEWLRFHAEEATKREYTSAYRIIYEAWICGMLPSDKFAFFLKMLRYPLYTNSIVTAMQDEFNKVYDSQNSSFTYEFTNESTEADFKQYLVDSKFWEKWVNESKEAMIKGVGSICIIDMPNNPGYETEPYFYFQDISAVVDIDYIKDTDRTIITSLLVRHDETTVFFMDDQRYAYFTSTAGGDYVLKSEVFHEFGYCPACFFWKEAIKAREPIVKKSMITGALNNLDFLLTAENWRRCLESYGAFPILEKIREDCTYYENIDGNQQVNCIEGWLPFPNAPKRCPVCEKNQTVGPGTVIEYDGAQSKDDVSNIGKARFISPDVDSLDYWSTRTDTLWDEIFYDCVGTSGEAMTQAVNKDQVHGNFATKQNKCMKVVGNMEDGVNFLLHGFADARYPGQLIRGIYRMGNKFYHETADEAQTQYKSAKDAEVPAYILAFKRQQVDAVNTKGNPVDAERLFITQNLEPFVDMSRIECKDAGFDVMFPEKYLLKADFSDRILRFERENGSILEFGRKLTFAKKIENITKILLSYGTTPVAPEPPPPKPPLSQ